MTMLPLSRSSRAVRRGGSLVFVGGMLAAAPALAQARPPARVAVPPLASAAAPLVLRGVTVIDVRDGQRLPNRTVTIVGTRIRTIAVAAKARVPVGARVIDAKGKYLIPGLWDMHVHIQKLGDIAFPLLVANGVTGVRDAGSEVPLATIAQWKRDIAAGNRVGPRYLVSGPAINEGGDDQDKVVQWQYQFISVPRADLLRVVDSLRQSGADFIKTYFLSRDGYFAVAAAARRVGILFGGHVPSNSNDGSRGIVGGLDASDSGATFLDHEPYLIKGACAGGNPTHIALDQCADLACGGFGEPDSFDLAGCQAVAAHYRRNNSWITVPAQVQLAELRGQKPGALLARSHELLRRFLPRSFPCFQDDGECTHVDTVPFREPSATADWIRYADRGPSRAVSHWQAGGLPLVIGTDMNLLPGGYFFHAGFVQHEALVGLVLAGMTPLAALQTATLNPALALRATDSLGTVAAGHVADLVVLDADPLADIWNTTKIHAVVANGRYYDRAALEQLLRHVEQVAKHR